MYNGESLAEENGKNQVETGSCMLPIFVFVMMQALVC